jgi:hypothetical protein
MDGFEAFYQQMDSKDLLDRHGPTLVADAKEILQQEPMARIAGTILQPDSREAPVLREAIAQLTGQVVPEGLLVGICPRAMLEQQLRKCADPEHWLEEAWQPQRMLPVLVATRDGFRFGFFPLG